MPSPAASVAVYVTVVDPSGNIDPGLIVLISITGPPQLSEAVGVVQLTVASHEAFALTVILEGQAIVGLVLSRTRTLNEQVDVFPPTSVAVYVTTVAPRPKISPGFFVLPNIAPQLSDTVGAVQLTVA